MAIVAILERGDDGPDLFDVAEAVAVDGRFLQRPVEALDHAVGLRFSHEGKALVDARNSICFRKSLAMSCVP